MMPRRTPGRLLQLSEIYARCWCRGGAARSMRTALRLSGMLAASIGRMMAVCIVPGSAWPVSLPFGRCVARV